MHTNKAVKNMNGLIISIIGGLIFLVFACPLLAGILNAGNIFGMAAGTVICLFGIFYNPAISFVRQLCENRICRILLIIILLISFAASVLFIGTFISIAANSADTSSGEATVITLGCRVRGDVPSLQLQARCRETAKYLKNNPNAVAILSGGQGPDENISEGECMYNLITEAGISPDRLFVENKSTSTDENIAFSKKIIDDKALSKDIIVVTSEYHLMRAKLICKKNGLNANGIPASSSFYSLPTFYTREVFAIWAQWLIRR